MNLSKIAFIFSLSFHLCVTWFFLRQPTDSQSHSVGTSSIKNRIGIYIVPATSTQIPKLPIMDALTQEVTSQSPDDNPSLIKPGETFELLSLENAALSVESNIINGPTSRTILESGEVFYYANALEQVAKELIAPEFDFSQLPSDMQGHVKLEIFINKFGEVVDVQVLSPEQMLKLSDAAVDGFRKVIYSPAIRGGINVASVKIIEMTILGEFNPAQVPMEVK